MFVKKKWSWWLHRLLLYKGVTGTKTPLKGPTDRGASLALLLEVGYNRLTALWGANLWSSLLGTDIWKSQKHVREHCHFVSGSLCLWHAHGHQRDVHGTGVCCIWADLFLLLIGKDWTDMAAPWAAHIWADLFLLLIGKDWTDMAAPWAAHIGSIKIISVV